MSRQDIIHKRDLSKFIRLYNVLSIKIEKFTNIYNLYWLFSDVRAGGEHLSIFILKTLYRHYIPNHIKLPLAINITQSCQHQIVILPFIRLHNF